MKSVFHVLESPSTPIPDHLKAIWPRLQQAYDGELRLGSSRRAPSEWWRNELEFLPHPQADRWVTRIHLFEEGPCSTSDTRFVGYIHVRPEWVNDPITIADAFLVPPLRMSSASYNLLPSYELSQIYGDPVFSCIPYAMPLLVGVCAHACLYMAMLCMIPYNARPIGPLDMTIWSALKSRGIEDFGPKIDPPIAIKLKGLTPRDSLEILRSKGSRLWALALPHKKTQDIRPFFAVIRQCIEAGLPVMLHVDFPTLYSDDILVGATNSQNDASNDANQDNDARHAILIIGTRVNPDGELTFVYHDPWAGPYMEVTHDTLADSLSWFKVVGDNEIEEERAAALAACPPEVRCSPMHCHLDIHQRKIQARTDNGQAPDIDLPEDFDSFDFEAELVSKSHMVRRIMRLMVSPFTPVDRRGEIELLRHLNKLFREGKIPAYVWIFTRKRNLSIGHETDAEIDEWGYIYDATPAVTSSDYGAAQAESHELPGHNINQAKHVSKPPCVNCIGRFYTTRTQEGKFVHVQEGLRGFGRRVHQRIEETQRRERKLIVEELDENGRVIPIGGTP